MNPKHKSTGLSGFATFCLCLRLPGVLLCGVVLLSVPGCGHNGRVAVEGTVTLDGQPLNEAQIEFIPAAGTTGPTVGGKIVDGKFTIPADKGPFVGNHKVKIIKAGATGRKRLDPRSNTMVDEYAQILPPRYNDQSQLDANVTPGGPNSFDFALTKK